MVLLQTIPLLSQPPMMPETSGCRRAGGQGVRVVNSEEPLGCLVYAKPALCLVLPDTSQPVGWLTHTPIHPPGCDRVLVSHAAVSLGRFYSTVRPFGFPGLGRTGPRFERSWDYRGTSMESTPDANSPSPEILTLEEVLIRAEQGKQRLIAAGLSTTRNIERRLAWKRSRGIDTTVEERLCGLESH